MFKFLINWKQQTNEKQLNRSLGKLSSFFEAMPHLKEQGVYVCGVYLYYASPLYIQIHSDVGGATVLSKRIDGIYLGGKINTTTNYVELVDEIIESLKLMYVTTKSTKES